MPLRAPTRTPTIQTGYCDENFVQSYPHGFATIDRENLATSPGEAGKAAEAVRAWSGAAARRTGREAAEGGLQFLAESGAADRDAARERRGAGRAIERARGVFRAGEPAQETQGQAAQGLRVETEAAASTAWEVTENGP